MWRRDNKALSKKELHIALEATGIDKDEIDGMLAAHDLDGNGTIELDEFIKLMKGTGAFEMA